MKRIFLSMTAILAAACLAQAPTQYQLVQTSNASGTHTFWVLPVGSSGSPAMLYDVESSGKVTLGSAFPPEKSRNDQAKAIAYISTIGEPSTWTIAQRKTLVNLVTGITPSKTAQ